ncbi:uncharacterized protein ZBIST_3247 [Zygosaccharomyces bailii]|nr:uncharacterized protein ZBIST_3247 [Zygosaccharomyces bailii]
MVSSLGYKARMFLFFSVCTASMLSRSPGYFINYKKSNRSESKFIFIVLIIRRSRVSPICVGHCCM